MSEMDYVRSIVEFLKENPEFVDVLKRALEIEDSAEKEGKYFLGWQWYEIPVSPVKLRKAILAGIVTVAYKSSSGGSYYVLMDRESVRQALKLYGEEEVPERPPEAGIPEDLFSSIVGYDDVKELLLKIIREDATVHVLMVGPPGSAKTTFLLELCRLPNSVYTLGSRSTKAGLGDYLLKVEPRWLIIDEIDEMDRGDYGVLLSLMQTGIVAETLYGRRRMKKLRTTVFAACNETKRIPRPLLSRFMILYFREYDRDEFMEVARRMLVRRGFDEELSNYIASAVWDELGSRDIRDVEKIAKIASSKEDVNQIVKLLKKYGPDFWRLHVQ